MNVCRYIQTKIYYIYSFYKGHLYRIGICTTKKKVYQRAQGTAGNK